LLSSPEGTGSDPTKSVIRTPGIRRPCKEVSTVGLRMKAPDRPDPCVPDPCVPDPSVSPEMTLEAAADPEMVEMPVAVVASSLFGGGLSMTMDSFGPGLDVTR
jgi:hypothetical protein